MLSKNNGSHNLSNESKELRTAARKRRYFEVSQSENVHQEFFKNMAWKLSAPLGLSGTYSTRGPMQSNISPNLKQADEVLQVLQGLSV